MRIFAVCCFAAVYKKMLILLAWSWYSWPTWTQFFPFPSCFAWHFDRTLCTASLAASIIARCNGHFSIGQSTSRWICVLSSFSTDATGTCCGANRCAGCQLSVCSFHTFARLEAFMSFSDENRGRKSQQKAIMWVVMLNREDLIDFEGRPINTHRWSPSAVTTP